jgi:hypothetical protein
VFGGACGAYDVFSDGSYWITQTKYCFEPVLHGGLDNLYRYHPNATIVLVVRKVDGWISSIKNWFRLAGRLKHFCRQPGYYTQWQNKTVTDDDLAQMYIDHANMVRSFAKAHPSLTYIEVELESNDTGRVLEERIGISRECWGHSNANSRQPKKANTNAPKL